MALITENSTDLCRTASLWGSNYLRMDLTSILCLLLITIFSTGRAAEPPLQDDAPSVLFERDEIMSLDLSFSMNTLLANRSDSADYIDATLSFEDQSMGSDINLEIRPRGNFRLNPNNCIFPPISLKFKKKEVKGSIFEGQKKLKLVTHCQDEMYVLKEYLAYKIYNLVNPNSFQVRLVKITYNDVDGKEESFSRYAFIIESDNALAKRIGGKVIGRKKYSKDLLNRRQTTLLYAFQFLIANRDWEIKFKKNMELIKMKDDSIIAVPYDFDLTGWVNAPYVAASLGSMAEDPDYRVLRNLCRSNAEWAECFQIYNSKEKEMNSLISKFKFLKRKERKSLLEFVKSFFVYVNNPEVLSALNSNCY